jgi:hypothetical protein
MHASDLIGLWRYDWARADLVVGVVVRLRPRSHGREMGGAVPSLAVAVQVHRHTRTRVPGGVAIVHVLEFEGSMVQDLEGEG